MRSKKETFIYVLSSKYIYPQTISGAGIKQAAFLFF